MVGEKKKRIVDSCMKLWMWGVFTELGKRRGSICTANSSCFNITGDTTTGSSYLACLGEFLKKIFFGR